MSNKRSAIDGQPSEKSKIAVAMSGGVDSSVAAALCVKKYGKEDVFGVTMRLFCYGKNSDQLSVNGDRGDKACCSTEAIEDARVVCDQLGIAHYVISFEKEFEKAVINDFVTEYKKGYTPNPCIRCNQIIKFDYLLKKVKSLGASKLATGHYARIVESIEYKVAGSAIHDTKYLLLKGYDSLKDQSYFLYGIKKKDLKDILFPLGDISKAETRKIAIKLKLKTAEKKESQEICFVSGKTEDYLRAKIKSKPGDIVDIKGNKVGEHEGIFGYTIGQRKGLGGGSHTPLYVVEIDKNKNRIVVGGERDLYKKELMLKEISWFSDVKMPIKCTAKIRYRMEDAECTAESQKPKAKSQNYKVKFKSPQRAVTPGQSIVFYDKEVVLGGGIIA